MSAALALRERLKTKLVQSVWLKVDLSSAEETCSTCELAEF